MRNEILVERFNFSSSVFIHKLVEIYMLSQIRKFLLFPPFLVSRKYDFGLTPPSRAEIAYSSLCILKYPLRISFKGRSQRLPCFNASDKKGPPIRYLINIHIFSQTCKSVLSPWDGFFKGSHRSE
ncbi:hypothetical protein CDAR_580121 [Caerostris darwini]|uniref:Uncharacterized protein n=1 Tax=Caerostris darwini TaxID=1538125 RepID=A0AAV4PNE7_9ARAC|nr:hypothetical protein CDAR_580121 [Caerostris darwini]